MPLIYAEKAMDHDAIETSPAKAIGLIHLSTPDPSVRIIPVTAPANGVLSAVGTVCLREAAR